MKTYALYHDPGPNVSEVDEMIRQLESQHMLEVQRVKLDTIEGADMAKLYDITQYPAFVVTRDDGQFVQSWVGKPFPLTDEIAGYARM